ncbi:serine threonine protein kinase [Moniliophthora roreri]|uniref:Mechanosensitive ion channel protein n=1 Tax=Moniliophthora roreri TaxID=221103 RepID=A0A0W0FGR4_MONRR|nr:serine threonine protein kinase [Moniliophthora roreri]
MYPPQPSENTHEPSASQFSLLSRSSDSANRRARMMEPTPDYAERGRIPGMPTPSTHRPGMSRNSSWDLLKRFEHSYEEFDSRNARENHLAFADGDVPQNKVSRLYHYLLNVSIVTRWFLFIIPVMGILWIPAILQFTTYPNGEIWGVKLLWWSIWFSVAWGGWWAALAVSRIFPALVRSTIGVIAVGTRKYIDWAAVLHRYIALFVWTLTMWISWQPLIDNRQRDDVGEKSRNATDIIAKLLFGIFLCSAALLFEKFAIQWIAGKFHERSYAERIADQKFAVRSLVTLYRNSSDIPGRSDTLKADASDPVVKTRKFFKRALKGVRLAATTTTTALGNVASEIAGSSVLQPNSPQAMVKTALESANKSRLLARRLFYSFVRPGSDYLFVEDIARFFTSQEEAERVFALFDRDGNGDASRDEIEMACMDFHREQLSIEHSMQDLDSAVGRLDNILMSLYVVIAALIIAVCLEAQLATLITGAGTLILGLSWLIGGSLTEILTSIIFLFIKHPFDVGDKIEVSKTTYTVKEIRLLSTILVDGNGTYVQAPNKVLNEQFILNIRRSPQQSETFTFDVAYDTTFEQLEQLRSKMFYFVQSQRRDFLPAFDVNVVDFPQQEKMTLSADIKYKSNSQQSAVKTKRRNRWICQLKTTLADVGIYGPSGDPASTPAPKRYTEVPWEEVKNEDEHKHRPQSTPAPSSGWKLTDQNAMMHSETDNIFDAPEELRMPEPRKQDTSSNHGTRTTSPAVMTMPMASSSFNTRAGADYIEMTDRR